MKTNSDITLIGDVDALIEYKDGRKEEISIHNTVLRAGRRALAKTLANQLGDDFVFYITRMVFGDGGTQGGVKKYVNSDRNGLFGTTRLSKPVLANIDATVSTQVIFTSVIKYEEAIGVVLSEMGLQLANGDLYSMTTFSDLTKTADMQITYNWRINFV
jgi:hypothetical protein